ncbi:MAG: S1 RNA-binding domain-containing protein, partial [Anaerolineae bacterium]|nr:S1 RNA-binding domain-containing protein [Anaerolineae bacterium]
VEAAAVAEEPEPTVPEDAPPVIPEVEPAAEEAAPVADAPEAAEDELALEVKLEERAEEHPMTALMEEEALAFERLRSGQIKQGEIVSVTPTEVLIDVGAKSEGLVPSKELERLGREGLESLQVGQKISVYVVRPEDRDGNLILSIRRAEEEDDWRWA